MPRTANHIQTGTGRSLTTSIAKKWLDDGDGLQDRGITRDLDWGIPVKKGEEDWPGMEGKVFYVWFDAPIEYVACAAEWVEAGTGPGSEKGWERWWRTDKGAEDVSICAIHRPRISCLPHVVFPRDDPRSGRPWSS